MPANNGNGLSMLSHYVYSMTNVRLRELTLGYDLPSRWFNNKVGMTVSLVGHNLWMIYKGAVRSPRSPLPRVPITRARLSSFLWRPDYRLQRKTPILKLQTNETISIIQ